jgi:hypothetical protein
MGHGAMKPIGYAAAPMSPKGEEAKPPNRAESHSGELDKIPKGEEAKPPNRSQSRSSELQCLEVKA